MSHLVSLTSGMGETGLFMNTKDTPITQEIPKVLGALCWEPETRTLRVHTSFMSSLRKLVLKYLNVSLLEARVILHCLYGVLETQISGPPFPGHA